jgi:hypothetical protein
MIVMKRKQLRILDYGLVIGFIVVLMTIMVSCSSSSSGTAGYTTPTPVATLYHNANYAYSVEVPPEWAVNASDVASVVISSPTDSNVHVRITASNDATNLSTWENDCVVVFKGQFPSYQSQSTSQTTVDGLPGELVNVTYTYGVPLQGTMLITVKGKNGYCLVGAAPPAEWSNNSGELSTILNSLKAN